MADPEFIGQGELASLIARLYTRRGRTTETPPIISLVRTQRTEESTLSAISRWLDDAMPRRVAHVLWDVSQPDEVVREEPDREPLRLTPKDVSIAREVLRGLAKELSSALGGSFQLPHLDLVMSLMAVQLRELDSRSGTASCAPYYVAAQRSTPTNQGPTSTQFSKWRRS